MNDIKRFAVQLHDFINIIELSKKPNITENKLLGNVILLFNYRESKATEIKDGTNTHNQHRQADFSWSFWATMKGMCGSFNLFCVSLPLYSPELKSSRRHRQLPSDPETSAHVTDQPSLLGVPDPVLSMFFPSILFLRVNVLRFILTPCMSVSPIDGVVSSESQTGKPHLSFVNKGKCEILFCNIWINKLAFCFSFSSCLIHSMSINVSGIQFFRILIYMMFVSWFNVYFCLFLFTCRWQGGCWVWWNGQQAYSPVPRQPPTFCWQPPTWHRWERTQRVLHEYVCPKIQAFSMRTI